MQSQRTERHAVVLALCYDDAAGEHRRGNGFPVHLDLRTYDSGETGSVGRRTYHKQTVAAMYGGRRFGDGDFLILPHKARHHKVGLYDLVQLKHGLAVDEFVCDFDGEKIRFQVRVFLLGLDLTDLVVGLDPEYSFDDEHRQNDTYHTQRICGCITAGHQVHLLA